jgi:ribosome biogenesis GTPase A
MGKIRRVLRCYQCGAILQDAKKDEKGYISSDILHNEEQQIMYCNSCYEKIKAINSGMLSTDADEEALKILDDAVATDALIIWVVDLFSFNGTLNPNIVKKVKKLKVVVIGNKFDLFPKKVSSESIAEYIKERFNEVGIKPYKIRIFKNAEDIDGHELIKDMNKAREGHDVYMIGSTASGKTSIINKGLKSYVNKSKRVIKTEVYPGTNLNVLEIPLSNSSFFYEVPGFSLVNSVYGKVEKETFKMVLPKSEIKITSKTLDNDESLMIGSLGAFQLVQGKSTPIKFYSSEMVETKKIKSVKLEAALIENTTKKSLRPVSERYTDFKDFDIFEYTMENDGELHDIAISGLGWISFIAKGQIIRVYAPKGTALKECKSKIR